MTAVATDLVVRKVATVRRSPEDAFRLFTAGMGTWWPADTHSIHKDRVRQIVVEEREGGEVYEVAASGEREHWAYVRAWEPPNRLVLEWKVNPNAAAPTEIEVTFTPEGDGTRVELVHRGWERLGDSARSAYDNYDTGWDHVLGRYEAAGNA